jgi:Domain of unknown function (DUF5655)
MRQQGFTFSKASWLERIHHNGGKPIYADSAAPRVRRARREARAPQAAPPALQSEPPPPSVAKAAAAPPPSPPPDAQLEPLLAKAKAYRPLALALMAQIRTVRPDARFLARDTFIAVADPLAFAHLGIGAKELRLHLALGAHDFDDVVKKGVPGGGLGKADTLTHMVVLTDARQVDRRLLELVARAAANVNG